MARTGIGSIITTTVHIFILKGKKGSDDKLKTKCTNNNISYTDLQQPSRVDDEDNLLPTVGDSVRIIFQPFRVSGPGRK